VAELVSTNSAMQRQLEAAPPSRTPVQDREAEPEWRLQEGKKLQFSHVSAQAKGLTRQLRIATRDGAPLTTTNMFDLLAVEEGDAWMDGVHHSGQLDKGQATVTTRDEHHRQ